MNISKDRLIDTHCHLNDDRYKEQFPQIIDEINEDMAFVITPAISMDTIDEVRTLSEKYPIIIPAYGVHPEECKDIEINDIEKKLNSIVGRNSIIGEIGLDYYNIFCEKKKQIEVFELQLNIAKKLNISVILHSREAFEDTFDIVKNFAYDKIVWHCFAYGTDEAKKVLDLGNMISFTGVITFKKAETMRDVATYVPMARIMAETDGPYLTPVPFRGKLNRPIYVKYIIEKIAALKNLDFEKTNQMLNENAHSFFNIPIK
ncbi:TatD family hydrolase [bacterium]|nr:TatD family hydrolase [bacterium]